MRSATRNMSQRLDITMDDAEMINLAVSEIRRLSVNGTAPTVEQYSVRRDPGTPSHTAVLRRTGLSWTDLARRAGLLHTRGRQVLQIMPAYIAEAVNHSCLCECGRPAIAVGWFMNLTGSDSTVSNAMLLCDECAPLVDKNVRVEPLSSGKN